MNKYIIALAVFGLVALPVKSEAYYVTSQSNTMAPATNRIITVDRRTPRVPPTVSSQPTNRRPQVIDHRTNDNQGSQGHGDEHDHNHDSIGVRQIIGTFIPFF